jgi:hypothetical protein
MLLSLSEIGLSDTGGLQVGAIRRRVEWLKIRRTGF